MISRAIKAILTVDASQYERAMRSAVGATEDLASATEQVGKKSPIQQMTTSLRENRDEWNQVANRALVVGGAMTVVTGGVLKTGIAYNTLRQTSTAALTTMLGSAEKANAQMDKLDNFARTSPFARQVFIRAQQQLVGFGLSAERVVPTLDAIQNAVAAVGGSSDDIASVVDTLAQMQSQGKLTGQTLNRLGLYGIDAASIIGERMGKTGEEIREMASKPGGIPADQVFDTLVDGMQEKFAGAADGLKDTFEGALDRVRGAFRDVSADFAAIFVSPDGGGLLVDWTNKLADLIRMFQRLPEPIKNAIGGTFAFSGIALVAAGSTIKLAIAAAEMHESMQKLNSSVPSLAGSIKGLGATIGTAALVFGVLEFDKYTKGWRIAQVDAQNLAAEIDGLTRSTSDLGPEFANLFGQSKGAIGSWALWREEVVSTDEVVSRFADNVKREYADTGIWQSLWSNAGEGSTQLVEQIELLDQALADLVNQGRIDEASASFQALVDSVPPEHVERVTGEFKMYNSALAEAAAAARNAEDPTSGLVRAQEALAAAAEEAADAQSELALATLEVERANISAMNAQIGYEDAIAKTHKTAKEMKGGIDAATGALDLQTEAGREGASALTGLAAQTERVMLEQLKAGRSTEDLGEEMDRARREFLKAADQMGINSQVALEMADDYGLTRGRVDELSASIEKTPKQHKTEMEVATRDAMQAVDALHSRIVSMRTHNIIIRTSFSGEGAQMLRLGQTGWNADGGLWDKAGSLGMVRAYRSGGFPFDGQIGSQQPQVRPYGGPRGLLWGEEGSGPWEAFISGHPGKRDRSLQIWQDVGRRLGAIEANANGSLRTYATQPAALNAVGASVDYARLAQAMAPYLTTAVREGAYGGTSVGVTQGFTGLASSADLAFAMSGGA